MVSTGICLQVLSDLLLGSDERIGRKQMDIASKSISDAGTQSQFDIPDGLIHLPQIRLNLKAILAQQSPDGAKDRSLSLGDEFVKIGALKRGAQEDIEGLVRDEMRFENCAYAFFTVLYHQFR